MLSRKLKGSGIALLLLLLLILPAAAAVSQEDGVYVGYRQMLMRAQAAGVGMIGAVLAGQLPKSHIVAQANILKQNAELIPDAFKKETTSGKTGARPEIWKNWKEFTTAALALEKESAKLAEAAQSGDPAAILTQVQKVGAACGGCHQSFRQAK